MFSKELNKKLDKYHLLNHYFYKAWNEGKLNREIIKDYAEQYYQHVKAFPRYISATHSLCEDLDKRKILLENLQDEEKDGADHPKLWKNFAIAMGSDSKKVEDDVWKTFVSENDKLPGWAKRMGELQAEGYKIQHDWDNISIVRPANVYGSWDNFDLDNSMVIPSLIRKADIAGKNGTLNVWGDGTPIRDFIHAKDCARGMLFCVENKITEPLNLGTGDGVSIKSIASIIAKQFNCNLKFDASKPNGDPIRLLDMSRSFSYGFNLSVSLEEGIGNACDWYLKHKPNLNYRYNAFYNK